MTIHRQLLPTLLLAVLAVGCAKTPATMVGSAPAPSGASETSGSSSAVGTARPLTSGSATPAAMRGATANATGATGAGRPVPGEFRSARELEDIHFDFDRYDIRPADARVLDAGAAWLKHNADHLVLIEGHCDVRGTSEYNMALGERRAKSTLNYLVSRGVAASRITIISYGEERPACAEATEACWAKSRRAHFLVKRG